MTWKFPTEVSVNCRECGEEFNIILTSKAPEDHPCPHCGMTSPFDFKAAEEVALKEAEKATRKILRRFK